MSFNPVRDPVFTTRDALDAWLQHQLDDFVMTAPYANNQVKFMLEVANRMRRVRDANLARLTGAA